METPELCLEFCVDRLKALGAEKFELAYERSSNQTIEVRDGALDHLSRSTEQGLSIRALKDQRMGFSYTFDLSRESLEAAAKQALEVGELMPADQHNDLGATEAGKNFSTMKYEDLGGFDPQGLDVALEQKIDLARRLEADAKARDARVKRVRKAAFAQAGGMSMLADSRGSIIKYPSTYFSAALLLVAEQGTDAETGYDSRSSTVFGKLDSDQVAPTAVANAVAGLGAGNCPTMDCKAVFKNSVVTDLLEFMAGSFSAESIDKKSSMLVGKRGQKLFSDKITIVDDARLPMGLATAPFDAEGTPSGTMTLVGAGTIENFLFDAYYARKLKEKPTGSSRRGSLKGPPSIGVSNLFLKPGSDSFDDLVRAAGRGVFITDLLGLHTANHVTGEFSIGASGILIENGVLTRPVKGFAIAGNLISLLHDVVAVGSDLRFWGSVGAPAFLVSKLNVSGATQQ